MLYDMNLGVEGRKSNMNEGLGYNTKGYQKIGDVETKYL